MTYGAPARFDGLALLNHAVLPHIDSPATPRPELWAPSLTNTVRKAS
jgi:hypothetical protein